MTNTKLRDESGAIGGMLFASLRGTLIGIGITLLLSLVMTAVALMTKDPDKLIGIFAYASLFIGALVCGALAIKSDKDKRLGASLISGGAYVFIIWLLSLFFRADTTDLMPPIWMAVGYIVCILGALVGGIVAKPKRVRIGDGKNNVTERFRRQLGKRV